MWFFTFIWSIYSTVYLLIFARNNNAHGCPFDNNTSVALLLSLKKLHRHLQPAAFHFDVNNFLYFFSLIVLFYFRFNFNLMWHIIIVIVIAIAIAIVITITTQIIITTEKQRSERKEEKKVECAPFSFPLNIPISDSNILVEDVTTNSNTWSWLCLLASGDSEKRRQVRTDYKKW